MILQELFTSSYKFGKVKDTPDEYRVNFYDPKTLSTVSFHATQVNDNNDWTIEFTRGGEHKTTGQGNAYKIFATIVAIIKDFIQDKNPPRVFFSAEELSRQSLYQTMISKMAGPMGYKLEPMPKMPDQFMLVKHEI